jgi:Tat protein translocase TatB subunit
MFDVGFWELVILFGLGLVILGPERLPKVAVQVGNWAGQARRMARSLTSQLRDELDINSQYTPPPSSQTYNRPGMDDLKPKTPDDDADDADADADENADNTIHAASDDRDHSDSGADVDGPVDEADPKAS